MNLFRNIFLVLGAPASCRYKMFDSFTFFVPHAETQKRRGRDMLGSPQDLAGNNRFGRKEQARRLSSQVWDVFSTWCSVGKENRAHRQDENLFEKVLKVLRGFTQIIITSLDNILLCDSAALREAFLKVLFNGCSLRKEQAGCLRSQEKHLCVFDGIFRVSSFQCSVFRKNRQDASAPIGYILCVSVPLRDGIFRVSSVQCSVFRKNRQDASAPIGYILCVSVPLRDGIFRVSSVQCSVFRKNRQDASAPIGKKLCISVPLRDGVFRVSSFQCSVFRKNRQDASAPIGEKLCAFEKIKRICVNLRNLRINILFNSQLLHRLLNTQRAGLAS